MTPSQNHNSSVLWYSASPLAVLLSGFSPFFPPLFVVSILLATKFGTQPTGDELPSPTTLGKQSSVTTSSRIPNSWLSSRFRMCLRPHCAIYPVIGLSKMQIPTAQKRGWSGESFGRRACTRSSLGGHGVELASCTGLLFLETHIISSHGLFR